MATTTNKAWQKDDDTTAIDQDAFINAFLDDLDASLFGIGANSAKPGSPDEGDTFYDTDASRFIKYNGSSWVQVMPDAANVIDSDHYVDGSIDSVHLAADVVTGAKIADDAIDSEHYVDGSIDNAHIANDAIDSEHYADGSIDNAHIADDAIDSEHYTDGSIDTAHLAADVVTGAKIADDAIDSEHYADGSIDNAHIADDAIDSEHYTDGSIDAAHLASNAVTSVKINADAVTGAKIADDAIDSEHYADGSIDSAHLADDAVTLAKTAAGTQGGIQYYAASGAPAELAAGTSGYFLKTQGAAANPVWAEAASGGFTQKIVNVSFFGLLGNGSSGGCADDNDAYYMPIDVLGDMTVTKIGLYIQTSSGNIDVGLYDSTGSKLQSTGSMGSPGTGVQIIAISSTNITAGQHYLAIAADNTTFKWGQSTGADTMATHMMQRETSDFPLPVSFTVGVWPTSHAAALGPPAMTLS